MGAHLCAKGHHPAFDSPVHCVESVARLFVRLLYTLGGRKIGVGCDHDGSSLGSAVCSGCGG